MVGPSSFLSAPAQVANIAYSSSPLYFELSLLRCVGAIHVGVAIAPPKPRRQRGAGAAAPRGQPADAGIVRDALLWRQRYCVSLQLGGKDHGTLMLGARLGELKQTRILAFGVQRFHPRLKRKREKFPNPQKILTPERNGVWGPRWHCRAHDGDVLARAMSALPPYISPERTRDASRVAERV